MQYFDLLLLGLTHFMMTVVWFDPLMCFSSSEGHYTNVVLNFIVNGELSSFGFLLSKY